MHKDYPDKLVVAVAASCALVLLLMVYIPRFMAFAPGLTGLGSLLAGYMVYKMRPAWPKEGLYIILGLVCLAGASTLWAIDPDFALSRTVKMAAILLSGVLFIAFFQAVSFFSPSTAAKTLSIGLGLMAALILTELLFDYPLYRLVRGFDENTPVDAARMNRSVNIAVACFPAIWALARQYGSKTVLAGLIVLFTAMLAFTDSQSAQLAFIVALIAIYAFPYSKRYAWLALKGIIALGILSAPWLAIWMFGSLAVVVDALPFLGDGSGYGANRMEIWDFVSRYALQNPLYGYGIEATRAVGSFDTMRLFHPGNTALHPHNFAVQIWIEFGLFGAVLACLFVSWLLHKIYQLEYHQARAVLPSFLALLVVASFGYGFWQSWWLGMIMFIWGLNIFAIKAVSVKTAP